MPCLLEQTTPIEEAFAGYYEMASPGDIIKAHNRFAIITNDKRWEGNLTTLRPGEGYFFCRMAPDAVTIPFFRPEIEGAPRRSLSSVSESGLYSNPNAATNMTMIAKVVDSQKSKVERLSVFIGSELVGVASPITVDGEQLYFITIQSDRVGEKLTFRTADGQWLNVQINDPYSEADRSTEGRKEIVNAQMVNTPDAHIGSLNAPVLLKPADGKPYKIIEHDHVIIIRDGERYDVTGQKIEK